MWGDTGGDARDVSQSSGLGSYERRGHQRILEAKKHRKTLQVMRDIRVLRYMASVCLMDAVCCV